MAASSKSSHRIASFGKHVVYRIWPATTAPTPPWRTISSTSYEKNLEEHVRPYVVPEDVIEPKSDKYWAPHPQTGVFGPTTEHQTVTGLNTKPAIEGQGTILEEKAWFRPTSLEDLEKPLHN